MAISTAEVTPPRRILAVVTVGRLTHAVPILEICRVLHRRGHIIEFACLEGCQNIADPYPFISKVHIIARAVDPIEDARIQNAVDEADISSANGRKGLLECLMFFDSFWKEAFDTLDILMGSPERPDFILADLLDHSCIDMMNKWHVPLAVHYPQMPWMFVPQKYIPGLPGFQRKLITSENASLWDRIREDMFALSLLFSMRHYGKWRAKMRKAAGAPPSPLMRKPNYLVFVNSCFGLEVPKDLPPLMTPIGPILSENYDPLGDELSSFLSSHHRVVYIAFGSHVKLSAWRIRAMIQGATSAMRSSDIDGVVWAMKIAKDGIQQLHLEQGPEPDSIDYQAILTNSHSQWKFIPWAPQRAILAHTSTRLFITHCGAASTNEATFHGVPMLALPIYGDQIANSRRAAAAGVALTLDKNAFTAHELLEKMQFILRDVDDSFARNVLRMKRIVTITSKRKELAADLIEEVLYDHELRWECSIHDDEWKGRSYIEGLEEGFNGVGRELRPMHLQTADARMGWVKGNNWDIWFVYASFVAAPFLVVKLLRSFW
ncbi:hypothetical protein B7463_g3072, partial [Scytalidium lignicola]